MNVEMNFACEVSQSVSYFTVPPRAHPSTGSQSGSAAPGLTQVPSVNVRGAQASRTTDDGVTEFHLGAKFTMYKLNRARTERSIKQRCSPLLLL